MLRCLFLLLPICLGSISEKRCRNAMIYGFTDAPPFNGQDVVMHFSKDYNETELNETVENLKPRVVSFSSCYERFRRKHGRLTSQIDAENNRDREWKDRVISLNVEKQCAEAKDALAKRNSEKWLFQEKESPYWNSQYNLCPTGRLKKEKTGEIRVLDMEISTGDDFDLLHPCVEFDCLRHFGKPIQKVPSYDQWYLDHTNTWESFHCVNEIKLKIV